MVNGGNNKMTGNNKFGESLFIKKGAESRGSAPFFVNLFVTLNNICIFAPTTSKQDNEKNRNANRIAGPGYCRQC